MASPPSVAWASSHSTPARRPERPRDEASTPTICSPLNDPPFRYLEFYAGIGGWRMAMEEALQQAATFTNIQSTQAVAALDHSDACLSVYSHNFPATTNEGNYNDPKPCRIEKITTDQLVDEWQADAWFLSPPCQPHTRQHDNQSVDLQDPRSASFLHLCRLLQDAQNIPETALPTLICLENVVGFETSASCRVWRKALQRRNYAVAHFHFTPTQVGLPNDRPRYFCLAVLQKKSIEMPPQWDGIVSVETNVEVSQPPRIRTSLQVLDIPEPSAVDMTKLPKIRDFLDDDSSISHHVTVPDKLLQRSASWCFDVVTQDSQESACFTSGYGRFLKGTGSVLYTGPLKAAGSHPFVNFVRQRPEHRTFDGDWANALSPGSLRYFSGMEIARLMGFAQNFSFPAASSAKQQWKLVGNSLNVRVAARLIILGFILSGKVSTAAVSARTVRHS